MTIDTVSSSVDQPIAVDVRFLVAGSLDNNSPLVYFLPVLTVFAYVRFHEHLSLVHYTVNVQGQFDTAGRAQTVSGVISAQFHAPASSSLIRVHVDACTRTASRKA